MHFAVLGWAVAVALAARILFPCLRTIFLPLRNVPGPIAARFTDLWYLWRVRKGSFEHDNIELHKKYGKLYPPISVPVLFLVSILTHLSQAR
jgi:hypothetical protein